MLFQGPTQHSDSILIGQGYPRTNSLDVAFFRKVSQDCTSFEIGFISWLKVVAFYSLEKALS